MKKIALFVILTVFFVLLPLKPHSCLCSSKYFCDFNGGNYLKPLDVPKAPHKPSKGTKPTPVQPPPRSEQNPSDPKLPTDPSMPGECPGCG